MRTEGPADPVYVSTCLALPTARQVILRMARTTAGSYNVSIDNLEPIRIPVPEPKLQQEFSAIIARTRGTLNTTETSARASQDLSASLMSYLLGDRGHLGVVTPAPSGHVRPSESAQHAPAGRIVRVGNHPRSDGTLVRRLRQHYKGHKNGSVFRKFLGGALMRSEDPSHPCLAPAPGKGHWEKQDEKTCHRCQPVEQSVSRPTEDAISVPMRLHSPSAGAQPV